MALPGDVAALTERPILHDNGEITLALRYEQLGGLVGFSGRWRGQLETWRDVEDGDRATRGVADALARFHLAIRESFERIGVDATMVEIDEAIATKEPERVATPGEQRLNAVMLVTLCLFAIGFFYVMA